MKHGLFFHHAAYGLVALAFLLLSPMAVPEASASDVSIICNKDVPEVSLSKGAVKNIFTGKKRIWSNGDKITFVVLKTGDTHKQFCKTYINKSTAQFMSHWKKMMFSGKGQMPKFFEQEQDMINFVAKTEGAIGYVSAGKASDQVKTLAIN